MLAMSLSLSFSWHCFLLRTLRPVYMEADHGLKVHSILLRYCKHLNHMMPLSLLSRIVEHVQDAFFDDECSHSLTLPFLCICLVEVASTINKTFKKPAKKEKGSRGGGGGGGGVRN